MLNVNLKECVVVLYRLQDSLIKKPIAKIDSKKLKPYLDSEPDSYIKSKRKRVKKIDKDYVYEEKLINEVKAEFILNDSFDSNLHSLQSDNQNIDMKLKNNLFSCTLCHKTFDCKIDLMHHTSTFHLNEILFMCPLCYHMKSPSEIIEFKKLNEQSDYLLYSFSQLSSLKGHLMDTHLQELFQTLDHTDNDINQLINTVLEKCHFIPNIKSENLSSLDLFEKNNMLIREDEEIIRSSALEDITCKGKKKKKYLLSGNKTDLLDITGVHEKRSETNLSCDICNRIFSHSGHLSRHVINIHMDPSKQYFICNICNSAAPHRAKTKSLFAQDEPLPHNIPESNLTISDMTEEPISFLFLTKLLLKEHNNRFHLNESGLHKQLQHGVNVHHRKYSCEECGMSYIDCRALERHRVRAHLLTPLGPGASFGKIKLEDWPVQMQPNSSTIDDLIYHCPLKRCGKTFATKFHLTIHIKKFHPHLHARFSRQRKTAVNSTALSFSSEAVCENEKRDNEHFLKSAPDRRTGFVGGFLPYNNEELVLDEKTGELVSTIDLQTGKNQIINQAIAEESGYHHRGGFYLPPCEFNSRSCSQMQTIVSDNDNVGNVDQISSSLGTGGGGFVNSVESALLNLDSETLASLTSEQILYFNKATAKVNAFDPANKPQFYCETCRESFGDRHSLVKHVRHYHEEKSYVCHICGRAYYQKPHLNRHLASTIHADVLPYQCAYCGKRFSAYGSVRKHVVDMFYHRDPTLLSSPKFMCHLCTPGEAFLPPGWDIQTYVNDVNHVLVTERAATLEARLLAAETTTTTSARNPTINSPPSALHQHRQRRRPPHEGGSDDDAEASSFISRQTTSADEAAVPNILLRDDVGNKEEQHRDILDRVLRDSSAVTTANPSQHDLLGQFRPETTRSAVHHPETTIKDSRSSPTDVAPHQDINEQQQLTNPKIDDDDYNMNHDLDALENYFEPYVPIIPPSFDPTTVTREGRPPPIKIIRFPNIKELITHYKKFHPGFDPLALPDGTGFGPIKITSQGYPERPLPRLLPPFMTYIDTNVNNLVPNHELTNNPNIESHADVVQAKEHSNSHDGPNPSKEEYYILDPVTGQIIHAHPSHFNLHGGTEQLMGINMDHHDSQISQLQIMFGNNNNTLQSNGDQMLPMKTLASNNHPAMIATSTNLPPSLPDPCAFVHLCEFCGKTFTYNKTLKEHIKKMHETQNLDSKRTSLTYRAGGSQRKNYNSGNYRMTAGREEPQISDMSLQNQRHPHHAAFLRGGAPLNDYVKNEMPQQPLPPEESNNTHLLHQHLKEQNPPPEQALPLLNLSHFVGLEPTTDSTMYYHHDQVQHHFNTSFPPRGLEDHQQHQVQVNNFNQNDHAPPILARRNDDETTLAQIMISQQHQLQQNNP